MVIPDNVNEIQKTAFEGCKELATVICKGETPARLGVGAFMKDEERSGTKYIKSIKVPTTAVSTYKSADGWKYFSDRISGY